MVQCAGFLHRHADQRPLGALRGLADRFRHFACLTGAVADAAFLITDHHQGGEGEPTATLHHFGDAVDGDQLVDQLIAAIAAAMVPIVVAAAATATALARFTCHSALSLE